MNFVFSFPVHEKLRIQNLDATLFQLPGDPPLHPFIRKNTFLQFPCTALKHIRKSIQLDRTSLSASCDPVDPDHVLSCIMKSFQHFPEKPRCHDATLHQFPLGFCIQIIPVMIHRRQDFISHLIGMDKIFSPAPFTFLTF